VVLSGLLSGAAAAAELGVEPRIIYAPPPPPPPRVWTWTGFYMGANGGYSSGADDYTQSLVVSPGPLSFSSFANNAINAKGGLLGLQAGFNWQTGPVVWGLEGDLQWASQSATACGHLCLQTVPGSLLGSSVYQKLKWFNTARARVGYANGPALLYITGGAACAGLEETGTITTSPPALTQSGAFSNRVGGVAYGAGIEMRVMWGWTGKLEYLHLDLGGPTNTFPLLPPIATAG